MSDSYWHQSMDETNLRDLLAALSSRSDVLSVCSETDGGIIGYALGEEHADQIVSALTLATDASVPAANIEVTLNRDDYVVRGDSYGFNEHAVTVWDSTDRDSGCAYTWSLVKDVSVKGPPAEGPS